jgi:molybdopterin/thiamine biosynthesis adenylyltransferase
MSLSLTRQHGIFDPHMPGQDTGITLIGAGALGSHIFTTLVELGLQRIAVFDDDIVESHNLSNQAFIASDISTPKVLSLMNWTTDKIGVDFARTLQFNPKRVTTAEQCVGTVILAIDSLQGRRELFENCIVGNTDIDHVLDIRMAATHGVIYSFNPHGLAEPYLNTLGNDDDAEVSACGAPYSVAPTAKVLANLACWQLIHARQNNGAGNQVLKVFLKPLMIATERLQK